MSLYFETIQLKDGELLNLDFHQQRFQRTRRREMGLRTHPFLDEVITVPGGLEHGVFRCRLIYGKEIERIEYEPYKRKDIQSLKLIQATDISYAFKYLNRNELEELYLQRGVCDDILIVHRGYISDTSYANIIFFDGKTWITPDTPLLPGTMRASLIAEGKISAARITPDDLNGFQRARLINALNNLNDGPEISMDAISW